MAFIERIKALFPDKYIKKDIRAGKKGDSTVALAKLSHVNTVGSQTETGLQLATDQVITNNASGDGIPILGLQKTATKITYSDGVVQEGWQLTIRALLDAAVTVSVPAVVVIPEVPGEANEGYYSPLQISGAVVCQDAASGGRVINSLSNGAEFTNSNGGDGLGSDFCGVVETTVGDTVTFNLTMVANQPLGTETGTATAVVRFEFLCYEGVTPILT